MTKETEHRNTVTDAAETIAEYWHRYGDLDWHRMMDEITYTARDRLIEMDMETAKERALDAKAEELGLRY